MIEYKKVRVTADDCILEELMRLSKVWAEENCCPAYYEDEHIIAYALGHISVQEEETSFNKIGEKAFELDEIYVVHTYRNKGIGKDLYRFLEKDIWNSVDVIGVMATSYQYNRLLKFYIEELGLQFNHALLVKRTHQ